MSKREQMQAIVLRTFDVGDADRFCVLLTRERGKIAARAKSVRKLGSRMGGILLPLQCASLELTEHSSGFVITGAQLESSPLRESEVAAFLLAQEGVELLLNLLQDDDPVPEIFDALEEFLRSCKESSTAFLAFGFRVLALMGLLPEIETMKQWGTCGEQESTFIVSAIEGASVPCEPTVRMHLQALLKSLLAEHLTSPLKAGEVAGKMR